MTSTLLVLMLLMKLPLAGLLWLVRWVVRESNEQQPETQTSGDEDGGSKIPRENPRRPLHPRHPRRGPHAGVSPPASPPRVRATRRPAGRVPR